jgi:hypothetical protein
MFYDSGIKMLELLEEYDLEEDGIPDNVRSAMDNILNPTGGYTSEQWARKAFEKMQIHCLAKGTVRSVTAIQGRITSAESLVKMLDAQGMVDRAAAQRRRIERLKAKLLSVQGE